MEADDFWLQWKLYSVDSHKLTSQEVHQLSLLIAIYKEGQVWKA